MEDSRKHKIITLQEGFQSRFARSNCDTVFGGGVLNPQPKGSKVLTPCGFVAIELLKKGDVICGIDESEQSVCHVTNEGEKDCIRLTMQDGTTVESALDHKWPIYKESRNEKFVATSWELLEAFNILNESGRDSDIWMSKYDHETYSLSSVRVVSCEDIGKKECICIGVSNKDELYITDGYMVTKNCGKTFAAILSVAEPALDPNFRAVFTRRNLGNLKTAGGIVDDFGTAYGDNIEVRVSDAPRITFPSGAYVDCIHIADETPSRLMERVKGIQADFIYMDELTSYQFSTFSILGTRLRGKGKWSGHIFGTTNPKRSHWTRKWLDWYIGIDGFIRSDRDGVVRYYYMMDERVDSVVWGDSKEEVYHICKNKIDEQLRRLGGDFTYKDMIRSFVFYVGRMSENMASINNNKGYAGSVAAVGGRRAKQLIEGNFNVDEDADEDAPLKPEEAMAVFNSDPQVNGDRCITCDLADIGKDNMVALAWDGFHVVDAMVIGYSTPRMNADRLLDFAKMYDVADAHIIYDGVNAAYMFDYIPDAIPYRSFEMPKGIDGRAVATLKDECYLRLIRTIKDGRISFSEKVANMQYHHNKDKADLYFANEFVDECSVIRWRELPSGKKRLYGKKEMNQHLGRGRSMDLLDPCAMRMYPVLQYRSGEELAMTADFDTSSGDEYNGGSDSIYLDSTWA